MTVEASAAGIQGTLDADPDLKPLWSYSPQVACCPMTDKKSRSMVVDLYLPREKVTMDNLYLITTHLMQQLRGQELDGVDMVEVLPCAFEGRADPAPILRMRVPVEAIREISMKDPNELVRRPKGDKMLTYWYWNPASVPAH